MFTTFDGRIGRKQFWLGIVFLVALSLVLNGVAMLLGFSEAYRFGQRIDFAGATQFLEGVDWVPTPIASFIIALLLAYPSLALNVKRRHDRNASGMDVVAIIVAHYLVQLSVMLGLGSNTLLIITLGLLPFNLGFAIVLGFLKGTTGPNSYGPDPV
jgi:uncharacterized membrane protein YhaH (DUF805 family)